jgi:hypothetical protein
MYVGGLDGGIWKTSNWLDPYPVWTPLTDVPQVPSQSVSIHEHDLVVVPTGRTSTIVYAAASGPGGGILRSFDGGKTWDFLANQQFDLAEFGALVVEPDSPNPGSTLYAAVNNGAVAGGVYKSTDFGATWTNMTPPGDPDFPDLTHASASDLLVMQEQGKTALYAAFAPDAVGNVAPASGIYKSYDGGQTWPLSAGSPSPAHSQSARPCAWPAVARPTKGFTSPCLIVQPLPRTDTFPPTRGTPGIR